MFGRMNEHFERLANSIKLNEGVELKAGNEFKNAGMNCEILDTNGDYTLVYCSNKVVEPYVVAYKVDENDGSWAQGHYFNDVDDAQEYYDKVTLESEELDECDMTKSLTEAVDEDKIDELLSDKRERVKYGPNRYVYAICRYLDYNVPWHLDPASGGIRVRYNKQTEDEAQAIVDNIKEAAKALGIRLIRAYVKQRDWGYDAFTVVPRYFHDIDEDMDDAQEYYDTDIMTAEEVTEWHDNADNYRKYEHSFERIYDILDERSTDHSGYIDKEYEGLKDEDKKEVTEIIKSCQDFIEEGCPRKLHKRRAVKEDLGEDIDKYQEWVDYDMKRYGKISGKTMREIKEAGLSVVKDQYGDYEVIGYDRDHH